MKALKTTAIFSTLVTLAMLFACQPEINSNESGEEGIGGGEDNSVHVTGITLDRSSANILEGGSLTLVATVKPDNAENKNVSWSSSESAVASVDNDGKVTGIKAGSATVTAKTEDGGKTASCVITVEPNEAPSITLGAENISAISVVLKGKANLKSSASSDLKIGFQYSKSAGILPTNSITVDAEDADANYNYTTSLTGLEPGTTYYFRSLVRQNGQDEYGETKGFKTKDVESLIETLDASDVEATKATLNAKLDLTDVKYNEISYGFYWGSENSQDLILTAGKVTNKKFSTTRDSFTSGRQYWYKAYVNLDNRLFFGELKSFETVQYVTDISLDKTSLILNEGEGYTFTPNITPENAANKTLDWTSSNETVVTVDETGNVKAVSKGTATITAQTKDGSGKQASCKVTVIRLVSNIELNKTSLVLFTGKSKTLTATVSPADASYPGVTWSSSNTAIATVSSSGKVSAIAPGNVTITAAATDNSGVSASCTLEVRQSVTSISLDKDRLYLKPGESVTLLPTFSPANAYNQTLTWTSSDTAVANVTTNGSVNAVGLGSATITATANDGSGKQATCIVLVRNPCPDGAVDLGLSVYWATCNIGANRPEEYGDYYAWGEVEPHYTEGHSQDSPCNNWRDGKTGYDWEDYKWCKGSKTTLTKYCTSSSYGTVDNKVSFKDYDYEDDVARKMLGGNWRIPTAAEWAELRDNCKWSWEISYVHGYGVAGVYVTSNIKGYKNNKIFLPLAGEWNWMGYYGKDNDQGEYWSSSLQTTGSPFWAVSLLLSSTKSVSVGSDYRSSGKSVRPIAQ